MEVEEGSGTEVDLLDQCRRAVDELAGQTGATKETRERAGVLLEHSFARFRQVWRRFGNGGGMFPSVSLQLSDT